MYKKLFVEINIESVLIFYVDDNWTRLFDLLNDRNLLREIDEFVSISGNTSCYRILHILRFRN